MSRMNLKKVTEWIAADVRHSDESDDAVDDAQIRLAAFMLDQPVELVERALKLHRTRVAEEALYAEAKKPKVTQ